MTCTTGTSTTKSKKSTKRSKTQPPPPRHTTAKPPTTAAASKPLPAIACRFLTEFDQAIPVNAEPNACSHVGDSPVKHDLNTRPLLRVHRPSEKELSVMRRTRGRTARPQTRKMFVAVSSVQVGATRNGDPWPAPGFTSQSGY